MKFSLIFITSLIILFPTLICEVCSIDSDCQELGSTQICFKGFCSDYYIDTPERTISYPLASIVFQKQYTEPVPKPYLYISSDRKIMVTASLTFIYIYNITKSRTPILLNSIDILQFECKYDMLLYVPDPQGNYFGPKDLVIYNLQNFTLHAKYTLPAQMVLFKFVARHKLIVLDVSDAEFGLKLVDVSNPTSFQTLHSFGFEMNIDYAFHSSTKFILTNSTHLLLYDFTSPTAPALLNKYETVEITKIYLSNDEKTLFLCCESDNVTLFDLTDLQNFIKIGSIEWISYSFSDVVVNPYGNYLVNDEKALDFNDFQDLKWVDFGLKSVGMFRFSEYWNSFFTFIDDELLKFTIQGDQMKKSGFFKYESSNSAIFEFINDVTIVYADDNRYFFLELFETDAPLSIKYTSSFESQTSTFSGISYLDIFDSGGIQAYLTLLVPNYYDWFVEIRTNPNYEDFSVKISEEGYLDTLNQSTILKDDLFVLTSSYTGMLLVNLTDYNYVFDPNGPRSFAISKNKKYGFHCCARSFLLDLNKFSILDNKTYNPNQNWEISTIISNDETLMFGINNISMLQIFDIKDPYNLVKLSHIQLDKILVKLLISYDDKLLFISTTNSIYILQISDPKNPYVISSLLFDQVIDFIVDARSRILYATYKKGSSYFFTNINVTEPLFSRSIDVKELVGPMKMKFEENSKLIILFGSSHIIYVDIVYSELLTIFKTFYLEDVNQVTNTLNQVQIAHGPHLSLDISFSVETYSVYFEEQKLRLGKNYFLKPILMNVINHGADNYKLAPVSSYYKLLDVRIISDNLLSNSFTSLPPWITVDYKTGTIYVNPTLPSQVKAYKLSFGFSVGKIDHTEFIGVANVHTIQDAQRLMVYELGLYVDEDGFLKNSFRPGKPIVLGPDYNNSRDDIYDILNAHYVDCYGLFSVEISLQVFAGDFLSIETPIFSEVTLEIKLDTPGVSFMNKKYNSLVSYIIFDNRALLTGFASDINNALKEIVIDFKNVTASSGSVSVQDGVNSPLIYGFTTITKYFRVNKSPTLFKSVGSQIRSISILTGVPFTFQIDPQSFIDADNDVLSYTLLTHDGSDRIPAWISLNGLILTGQPPEEFGLTVGFRLTASDGYKTIYEEFEIEVLPSPIYILKLIGTIAGPLIGALGALVYANQIYNVFCKKRYTYPRVFVVKPENELKEDSIYSLTVVGEERIEAKRIWAKMIKTLKKKKDKRLRDPLSAFFTDSYEINHEAMQKAIESEKDVLRLQNLKTMKKNEKRNFTQAKNFLSVKNLDQNIISMMIEKELIYLLLKKLKDTKKLFDLLKVQWYEFAQYENKSLDASKRYSMNTTKFEARLKSIFEDKETKKKINQQKAHIELLKRALTIYINQKFQLFCMENEFVSVPNKFVYRNTCIGKIKHFAKLNVRPLHINNKNVVGYGIKIKYSKSQIKFIGIPYKEIEGVVLVFQLKNMRGRILHEYWIEGSNSAITEKDNFISKLIVSSKLKVSGNEQEEQEEKAERLEREEEEGHDASIHIVPHSDLQSHDFASNRQMLQPDYIQELEKVEVNNLSFNFDEVDENNLKTDWNNKNTHPEL